MSIHKSELIVSDRQGPTIFAGPVNQLGRQNTQQATSKLFTPEAVMSALSAQKWQPPTTANSVQLSTPQLDSTP